MISLLFHLIITFCTIVYNNDVFKQHQKNSMTFKTWINDLRDVQSVINNISNTRVIIDGATGLLNTSSLKEMSSAVSGLSKEQALLVLSTKNLNAAQQEQVLLAAGIISSENSITASAISQALAKTQLSATEKEALLTKLGLIDATTGEAIANATCTKEELLKALATKGIIGADADAIISSIGLTSANSAQAISFDLLTASIWANIKALGKWLITNPVGWAILGGTAIFGLVKAYDALTDSVEEVEERTENLLESYNSAISEANSNAKTIESLADRYETLSKGVNNLGENVSLTSDEYSEYNDIVNQIADMFPTLITGYTDEGNAILSLKGNVEKLRDAYKEAQTEAYNLLIVSGEDSDGNDIISNYKNQINGKESSLSKTSSYINGEGGAKDAIDIITRLTGTLTPDEFRDTYNELYEQYKNIWNSDKIQDALKSSGFEELSHAPKWGELTSDDLAKVKSTAQATIQTYKAEIDSQLKNVDTLANAYLMTNEDYSKLNEQSQTAASLIVNSITEDIANGFKTKEDVGAYVANIASKIRDNPDLNKSLVDLFTEDFSSMSVDEVKSKLDGYINTIAKVLNEDPVELKIRLGFDDYDDVEPLKTKVQGFLKDEFDDKVGELSLDDLQVASKLEIPEGTLLSWDELKQKIEETKNAASEETPISSTDILAQVQALSTGLDQLDKIYADVYDKEDFDWSSILNNDGFKEAFGNMTNVTEEYKNAYDDFIETISNNPSDLSACQSAFDNLATAYIYNSDALKNVTEETKASTIAMLSQMGVVNAAEVVNYRLGASESYAADTGKDLESATLSEITAFAKEADMSDITKASLAAYVIEKIHAASITITTSADINNLTALCSQLGVAGTALAQFARLKAIAMDTSGKYTDGYKEYATTAADQILQNAVNAAQTKYTPQFGGGSATSKAMDDAAKSAKKASDTAKETAQNIDWIETKLKLASKETEKLSKSFDKAFGMDQTRERYHAYISQIESEIQDNTTAAQVYQEKLNQIGLSYEWIAKIQSGAFSIDSITDENLKTQISEYQTYSDKLNSCYDTIESLEEERLQASVNYAEKLIDSHEKEIDSINKLIDRRKALVSLKETFGLSASKSDLKYQQDQYEQEIDALERQNKEIYDLMWTTTYGDEAWQKYNDQMIENTSSIQDLTQSLADLASEMANLPIDKYEKALDKISAKNDLLDAKLENATSDKAKSKIIGSQLKLTRKKDNSAQSAAKTTQSNLNQSVKDLRTATKKDNNISVYNVDASGPNVKARTAVNDYYKKVQNYTKAKKQIPASLISKISGDGYSTLSKACTNYNAALVANDTAQETAALSRETIRQELADLAEQRASLAKTTADSKVEKYDSKDELYDAKLDNATSTSSKNKLIDRKISNINNRQSAYNTAVKADNKNIKSAQKNISKIKSTKKNKKILASIKKAAKAGKRISQSLLNKAAKLNDGGKLYDACIQYNAYLDAKEADKATADLYKETAKQDKATLAKEKFDNIASKYDNKISSNEQKKTKINNRISLAEESGEQANVSDYKSLISAENGEYQKLIKEREELRRNLEESVVNGSIKKGSDEWYDMVAKINDVTNAIDESIRSIKQYQNALRQLKWDTFDKSLETVKRVNSEADYYIDLLSHKDMTDKDTGNFTEYGIATIGLHKTNYDNYIAQAEAYQDEYNNIMEQIRKGELSTSDENVIQRLRDLQDAHREAKKSAEDELESINDLVKQGYEAQTDALSKLIEKYKKLKDSELDAYKYQKEIAEKTKQIASLQKQLIPYSNNDTEESRAQIQKLKVELQNAKDDLNDTIYSKYLSDTEDMLDDLMNDYQEFIDEKINDTNTILDSIKGLIGGDDGIIATLKSLDSSLTNTTKDQIDSSTTNGGDGGQGAKDYVNNTVTNDRNTINSSHKTGLLRPTAVGTITLDNSLESKKKNTTSIDDKLKTEKKAVKDAINSGKSRSKKLTDKENNEHADLWKYIVKNYGRTPTNKMYKKLGGILGVKTDDTVTSKQKTAILNRMKFNGYKKGSEHIDKSQLAWTQENKRELIYRASDGAVLTKLNPGDKVFTNEMTENLWKLAKTNPSLLYSSTNFVPKLPDIAKSAGTSTIVEVGDIVMNGVNDPETFGRQLREEICKNGKTTQCIAEAVSAKQLGKNRNSIGNARLYK